MKDYLKKNKGHILLPLILLPFIVLLFYILGGGTKAGENKEKLEQGMENGMNTYLPQAEQSIEIFDKMEAYQQREALAEHLIEIDDTIKQSEEEISPSDTTDQSVLLEQLKTQPKASTSRQLLAHIRDKEEQLKAENKQEVMVQKKKIPKQAIIRKTNPVHSKANDQAKNALRELEEVEQLFDKHAQMSQENDSLKFYMQQMDAQLKALKKKQNQNYRVSKGPGKRIKVKEEGRPMIQAEVYETSKLLPGQRIKLRLLEDVWVNGYRIPANAFVYGTVDLKNERLKVLITSLPMKDLFLPVELEVMDLDGLEGLYVPGNAARKVSKDIGGSASTSALWGMSQAPLTNLSIQTADRTSQALLKRTRLKKVTVKKNTRVYLVNKE